MAIACHFTLEGEKQGKIEGSCDMEGREGTLIGHWFAHQVIMPHNPMDGFPTAKPDHYPLSIIITHDQCSPKLHQALCTGEHFKNVEIKWYKVNKYGHEKHYFTHYLKDAVITRIESFMPNTISSYTAHLPHMEKVSFSYRYIRWTHEPNGIEAEDPYINEYGKNPLKDIGCALKIAGLVAVESKKIAIEDTIKTGIDVGLARLLEFLKAPWYVMEAYEEYQKIKKEHGIREDTDHGYREKILNLSHKVKHIKDETYGHE